MKTTRFGFNSNVSLKHKIVGGVLLFFAVCYWIGVIALFSGNNTLSDDFVAMILFIFIAIALSSFAILFLSGIMARLRPRPFGHWILGIVFSILAFACWGSITATEDRTDFTLVMLTIMGILFTILSILYLSGIMARIKHAKEHKKPEKHNSNNENTLAFENIDYIDEALISVDYMEGYDFEYFCADLLRANGFAEVSVTQSSGDQGVDILATKDFVKYAIQCKNYSSHLGNTPIQEVNAGKIFYHCHVAVVITNSTFTSGAIELAKATGVLLWDRTMLANLIKNAKHYQRFDFR